ncbi:MAG: DUF4294 domain-containing protein [Saprospiraceae bacterium]|nr:DUF4294 domain-containing protein [Saprospiraceae bacterium]
MRYIIIFISFILAGTLSAQTDVIKKKPGSDDIPKTRVNIDGNLYTAIVTEDGDTLILADLDDISISSPRHFASDEDYQKYMKFRRYAAIVYPYARESIRIYREYKYAQENLSARKAKKRLKELQDELTLQFEEPLKKLTKLQGKILFKMIEKELDMPMYDVLRDVKGPFTAFYWHNFSKLYSYDLKEGYNEGQYPILDLVLEDFDLSYRIQNATSLKYISIDKVRKKGK